MIQVILHILLSIIFAYCAACVAYLFVAALIGLTRKKNAYPVVPEKKRMAVLITAYKEDEVILHTAREAAHHNYPADKFSVFLAADHLQPHTIAALQQLPVKATEVFFDSGSKARSLNFLLNIIVETDYDVALVLDGDNVMEQGFLEKINSCFQSGYRAAQGHRTAKNQNTPVAVLDAVSEEINNTLFRRAQRAMGLSAAIIGSGMAFELRKLKEVYNKPGILDNPACDREVDFEMMKAGIVVEYLDDAFVLDEKVPTRNVYQNQRRRWLESQVFHLKLFFSLHEHVPVKTADYWNKLFINLIPPRILFIGWFVVVAVLFCIDLIFKTSLIFPSAFFWMVLMALYVLSMLLAIPRRLYTMRTLRAFFHLPVLLLSFIKAALTMQSNRKNFMHTPKSFTEKGL